MPENSRSSTRRRSRPPTTAATHAVGFHPEGGRGHRRRRPDRQARDRHRRPRPASAPRPPGPWRARARGHPRRPQRRGRQRVADDIADHALAARGSRRAAGSGRPRVGSRLRRPLERAAATSWSTTPAIMALPELHRTAEGWELQFATNHLGHFNLARGLHDALAAAGGARIVVGQFQRATVSRRSSSTTSTSSVAPTRRGRPTGSRRPANVLFAVEAGQAWAEDGITANALMPGRHPHQPAAPPVGRHHGADPGDLRQLQLEDPRNRALRRLSCVAASPLVDGITGRYFEDCGEAATDHRPRQSKTVSAHTRSTKTPPPDSGQVTADLLQS